MKNNPDHQIIIGLDVGTTGVKVLAASPEGDTIAVAEATYSLSQPGQGYREQDPDEILQVTEQTLQKVLDQIHAPVSVICFGAAMHSLIAVNEQAQAITPAIIWADVRSANYARTLRSIPLGKQIYEASGAPIHAMLPLCKIAWLRDQQPDIFRKTYKFISIKEYCIAQWFGEYVVDYAIAGASGLWDKKSRQWNKQAMHWAGIDAVKLSTPVSPTTTLSRPDFKYFKHTLITDDTVFVIGASDGCLANLNASGFNEEEATLTLGTSGAIRITARETTPDPNLSIFDYYLTEQYHVIGGPTNNGGIVLEWLKQKFYPEITDTAIILQKAQEIPAGTEGLVCVPYFFGERAPLWREDISGQFYGVQSIHGRDHFARAALEGIIFNLLGIAQTLEKASSNKIRAIWTDGGMMRSGFIAQLIADVFELPVYYAGSSHGVARGAVLLGAHALQLIELEQIKVEKKQVFKPNAETSSALANAYQIFSRLKEAY